MSVVIILTLLVTLEFTVNLIFKINLLELNHRHDASVYKIFLERRSIQASSDKTCALKNAEKRRFEKGKTFLNKEKIKNEVLGMTKMRYHFFQKLNILSQIFLLFMVASNVT